MSMIVTGIEWDTAGCGVSREENESDEEALDLPYETIVPDMPEDDVADYLADEWGFCVCGFSIRRKHAEL